MSFKLCVQYGSRSTRALSNYLWVHRFCPHILQSALQHVSIFFCNAHIGRLVLGPGSVSLKPPKLRRDLRGTSLHPSSIARYSRRGWRLRESVVNRDPDPHSNSLAKRELGPKPTGWGSLLKYTPKSTDSEKKNRLSPSFHSWGELTADRSGCASVREESEERGVLEVDLRWKGRERGAV